MNPSETGLQQKCGERATQNAEADTVQGSRDKRSALRDARKLVVAGQHHWVGSATVFDELVRTIENGPQQLTMAPQQRIDRPIER